MEQNISLEIQLDLIQPLSAPIVIQSTEHLNEVISEKDFLDDLAKQIRSFWKSLKDKAFQAHREVCQKENKMLEKVEPQISARKAAIQEWMLKEDARLTAERKAEEQRLAAERAEAESVAAMISEALETTTAAPMPVQLTTVPKRVEAPTQDKSVVESHTFDINNPYKINIEYLMADKIKIQKVVTKMGEDAIKVVGEGITVRKVINLRAKK